MEFGSQLSLPHGLVEVEGLEKMLLLLFMLSYPRRDGWMAGYHVFNPLQLILPPLASSYLHLRNDLLYRCRPLLLKRNLIWAIIKNFDPRAPSPVLDSLLFRFVRDYADHIRSQLLNNNFVVIFFISNWHIKGPDFLRIMPRAILNRRAYAYVFTL